MDEAQPIEVAAGDALHLLGLLAEPERLRVVSAIVLGYSSIADIAQVTGVGVRAVERGLARLVAGGLVVHDSESGYRLAIEELKAVARLTARSREEDDPPGPPDKAKIMRAFFSGGRLVSIPMVRSKRIVVLDYLAQGFDPGKRYRENEVNELLGGFNEDYAALRRWLVDEGFLTRERGTYWRIGGTVDVE